jgi:hypothetical protein
MWIMDCNINHADMNPGSGFDQQSLLSSLEKCCIRIVRHEQPVEELKDFAIEV